MNERELFIAALRIANEGERSAYLDQSCADDPVLKKRVEALLRAHFESDDRFERPLVDQAIIDATIGSASGHPVTEAAGGHAPGPEGGPASATVTAEFHADAKPDVQIAGRYTLREKIGEGGMGEVWVAKQSEPVKRKVALKLIKQGMDSRAVLQRFEQERQALAMMDHPNIAKVFDAGLTPGGQPFFVMELVHGLPLNKFCDELKLTPKERLELFVPICQAVQHAHQKGIVHRDLKPANILITMVDARPVPKVIDFGVAKATGGKLTDESLSTQFGAIVGTFEYMSPEQTGFTGQDIDTRADIYSLGVILYELLTGLRPFDAVRLKRAALTEMIRIIREEEPSKPSTRLSTDASLPSLAAMRQTEPRKLMALLRGELDWVIMKCLEKHRERRYETASALARDIQRYLADEPVEARPPSTGYRLGKFIKRHRASAIAASLVLLALLVGIAGTSYGLLHAEARRKEAEAARKAEARERSLAESERDKARAAEAESRAINDFLTQDLLTQAEPANSAVEDHVELVDVLDRAAAKVGERFARQPELESALRKTIAYTYHGLASWEKAEAQWRSLLDAARKRETGLAHTYIASSELAHILRHRGRRDPEVMKMAEDAVEGLTRVLGPDHPDTLTALNYLAGAYQEVGRLPEAIAMLERVRDARIAKLGPDHPETLTTLCGLALAYQAVGRLPEAIALLERVRDAQIAKLGPNHPDTLKMLGNLATAYKDAGKLPGAITPFERVRDGMIAKFGPDHPDTLATLNSLAIAYEDAGKLPEAIALFERVRDAQIAKLGPDHPNTLTTLNNLAATYRDAGKLPEAIALHERVRDARIAKLGPDHPGTLTTLGNLAWAYQSVGKLPEAITLFERVRDAQIAKLGPDHPDTLTTLHNLALAYQAVGRLPEAIALFERVRDAKIAKLGPDHPDTLTTLNNLAGAYQAAGKLPEAIALLERVRDAQIAKLGPDHPSTLATLNNLAVAYRDAGKLAEAIALFERVRDARIAKLGPDHPSTLKTLGNLAMAYQDAGKLPEAIALLERSRDGMIAKLGPDHADTLTTLTNLAALYGRTKQLDKSVPLYEHVLKRQEAKLGRQHPNTQLTVGSLGVTYKDAGRLKEAIPLLEEAHQAAKRFPTLRWVAIQLIDAYAKAGENTKLADLLREQLAEAHKTLPKDSPQLAGMLAQIGSSLLEQKKWTEAEPLLRECLAIREKQKPDEWLTFNTKSMLGGALLGQKKYAQAEPLLLNGYEGMKKQEDKIPPQAKNRLSQAVERLVQFYEATSKPGEAATWRKELKARQDVQRNRREKRRRRGLECRCKPSRRPPFREGRVTPW